MKRYLKDRRLDLELTEKTKTFLAEVGFDQLYGARPLKRAIQNEILNPLAKSLIERTFKEGDVVLADMEGDKVVFNKKHVKDEEKVKVKQ
jgi:ATP-dependent Clp protease ATP-binding subunit ClpB